MALLEILDIENPDLRGQCSRVNFVPEDFEDTIADMFETMISHRGVGLSAPQVGIYQRFFLYTLDIESTEYRVVVNPKILARSGRSIAEEGCLSYEGYTGQVERDFQITVRYQDENLKTVERTVDGWEARIIAHEMDHLEGILFIDRMIAGTLKSPEDKAREEAEAQAKREAAGANGRATIPAPQREPVPMI